MIAADTSTVVAFVQGNDGEDVELFDSALVTGSAYMPPVVLSEFLSQPGLSAGARRLALQMPVLSVADGYWARAADTRARLLALRLRARLPDALIAQSCLDHDVALITRDRDFRHFAKHCGLRLA